MADFLRHYLPFSAYPYQGSSEGCLLCGSERHETLATWDRRIKRLRTVICLDCGLLRSDPMPTEAELASYYGSVYRLDYQLALRGGPPKVHRYRSQRLAERRLARYGAVLPAKGRVLDLGAGSGEFLAACRDRGFGVRGLEPGSDYAAFARDRHGIDVLTGGWGADLGGERFDLITSFQVFEHLRDPVGALLWLKEHLAEEGVIVLEVPDMTPNRERLFERVHFAHVHGFTPRTLTALAAACGLVPDPRLPATTTGQAFRRPGPEDAVPPLRDPDHARALAAAYDRTDVPRHLLRFTWVGDAWRRVSKELRDGRAARQVGRSR